LQESSYVAHFKGCKPMNSIAQKSLATPIAMAKEMLISAGNKALRSFIVPIHPPLSEKAIVASSCQLVSRSFDFSHQ
jgi:hypothetical protein